MFWNTEQPKQRVAAALAVFLLGSASLPAVANPPAETPSSAGAAEGAYRQVISSAIEEYRRGHWTEARGLFEQAHELQPSARTLRGVGLAAFEDRSYVDAIRYLRQALADERKPLTAEQRTAVRKVIDRAYSFIARYRIQLDPAKAEVRVDMLEPFFVEGELLLDPGEHVLTVEAEGYRPIRNVLHPRPREERTLHIALEAETEARAQTARDDTPQRKWYKSPWLWTSIAVVAGGAVAGTVVGLNRRDPGVAPPNGGDTNTSLTGP